MAFVHLHTHSTYSLLQGLPSVKAMIEAAVNEKMPALALTDTSNMYGMIEFAQAAKKAGVKPIIGCELFYRNESDPSGSAFSIILLSENLEGYRHLIRLVSEAHLCSADPLRPVVTPVLMKQFGQGLFALTGDLNGEIPSAFRAGDDDRAQGALDRLCELFGPEHIALEVQPQATIPERNLINEKIIALGRQHHLPVVATNDVHYIHKDDAQAQDVLVCIGQKTQLSDKNRLSLQGHDFSFRSEEEMRACFPDHPEIIDATSVVASRLTCDLEFGIIQIPHYSGDSGRPYEEELRDLCIKGLTRRYHLNTEELDLIRSGQAHSYEEIIKRMDFELEVINKTGFASYFLIVQDIVNWAKEHGVVVGPGRGSAAGSLVSYLTNITNIDPLQYDLLFERFLNPERVSMPDIDLDFADTRRDEVIEYVKERYGHDHVAHIITFGTMAARAAVRDVGRVLGLPYSQCDMIAKLIPMFTTLDEALQGVEELKTLAEEDPDTRRLLDTAKKLEGVSRHASIHACGILITKGPLTDHAPLQYASTEDRTLVSQYSLHPIEDLGLLKVDFLGLKNLTIIEHALKLIQTTRSINLSMDDIPLDDESTYRLFQRGETTGVFQFESAGMKRYLMQLKPTEFEDVIAMVALYRPGPMEFIPEYIAGKHGKRSIQYLHRKLEPILGKTYGIAVYQEQVMQIARDLCGFSLGEADVLRKAIGKKIKSLLLEQRDKFIDGGVRNGIPRETAAKLFDFTEPFARYGFNRSHAACYALIGYQTAYLKARFPHAFMAALLTSDMDNTDRIAIEVTEAQRMGLKVLPPDVNESEATFTVIRRPSDGKEAIRFGLSAIKNVGDHVIETLIQERKSHGPFRSIEDLLCRIPNKDLNKKSVESLIKGGAVDRFGDRNLFIANLDLFLSFARSHHSNQARGQTSLFGMLPAGESPRLALKPAETSSRTQTLLWEKQLLGLYVSDHPLSPYKAAIESMGTPCKEVAALANGQSVTIAGMITKVQRVLTKKKERMLFVQIEDLTGSIEALVFPKVLNETADLWVEDHIVRVRGKLSSRDEIPKLLVDKVKRLTLPADPPTRQRLSPSPSLTTPI